MGRRHYPNQRSAHTTLAGLRVLPLVLLVACNQRPQDPAFYEGPVDPNWQLVFSDEFDEADGSAPDDASWSFDIGGHGWGNEELQYYTDDVANAAVSDGSLVIRALEQTFDGNDYTSARLRSEGKFEQAYGRFEARLKLPVGQGIWPAFWLLGNDFSTTGWPECGEVDIMEYRGQEARRVFGSVHGPGYSGNNPVTDRFDLHDGTFNDDFHLFAVEWTPEGIRWLVDDQQYHSVTPEALGERPWVFDHPFFIVLNLAVGGLFSGNPDSSTRFPQALEVDFVRVYRLAD